MLLHYRPLLHFVVISFAHDVHIISKPFIQSSEMLSFFIPYSKMYTYFACCGHFMHTHDILLW